MAAKLSSAVDEESDDDNVVVAVVDAEESTEKKTKGRKLRGKMVDNFAQRKNPLKAALKAVNLTQKKNPVSSAPKATPSPSKLTMDRVKSGAMIAVPSIIDHHLERAQAGGFDRIKSGAAFGKAATILPFGVVATDGLKNRPKVMSCFRQEQALISDWLEKRDPKDANVWTKVWCILTEAELAYFEDQSCEVLKGSLKIELGTRFFSFTADKAPGDSFKYKAKRPHGIVVDIEPDAGKTRKRRFAYFDCKSGDVQLEWLMHCKKITSHRESIVILHIYDLGTQSGMSAANMVLQAYGTGAFHAGVEVNGVEWSYGYCEEDEGSGVFSSEPTKCDMHIYRMAVPMGRTSLSKTKVDALIARLRRDWPGCEYDLLRHNCCSFSDTVCQELGVGHLPDWVTNLANKSGEWYESFANVTNVLPAMPALPTLNFWGKAATDGYDDDLSKSNELDGLGTNSLNSPRSLRRKRNERQNVAAASRQSGSRNSGLIQKLEEDEEDFDTDIMVVCLSSTG